MQDHIGSALRAVDRQAEDHLHRSVAVHVYDGEFLRSGGDIALRALHDLIEVDLLAAQPKPALPPQDRLILGHHRRVARVPVEVREGDQVPKVHPVRALGDDFAAAPGEEQREGKGNHQRRLVSSSCHPSGLLSEHLSVQYSRGLVRGQVPCDLTKL